MKQRKQIPTRVFASGIILALLFSIAFLQRILPITGWNNFPQNYTVDGEAILTNVDGYYYLNAAKEILQGTYSTQETHRATPDTIPRSPIPPLLSVLTAAIARVSGISINWVGAMLPAILSLFIAVPIFFLGWHYGGAIAATTATAITLLAPAFLMRNNFGFYDTDCLNAFFPYSCSVLFLLFAIKEDRQRYLFLLAGVVTASLFLWWWDQVITVPLVLGFAPLCMALLFFYRPGKREGILFLITAFMFCIIATGLLGTETFITIPQNIIRMFSYISKQNPTSYPAIGLSIAEQSPMGWQTFSRQTFVYPVLLPFALAGIALFIYRAKKEITLLLPLLGVATFTFFFATRFVIFAVPLISLGLGILLEEIYRIAFRTNNSWYRWGYTVCTSSLLILICWGNFQNTPNLTPIFNSPNLIGMKSLQKVEKDAVIWSWWDQGHPLVYWSERDTINDGMIHDNERSHCTAVPLAASNDRFAANYMNFYISQGKSGRRKFLKLAEDNNLDGEKALQKILTAGPEQTTKLYPQLPANIAKEMEQILFPDQKRPIYLFLDMRQTNSIWVHLFGSWNMKQKSGQKVLPTETFLLSEENKEQLLRGEWLTGAYFKVNKELLQIYFPTFCKEPLQLSELTVTTEDGTATTLSKKREERVFSFENGVIAPEKEKWFTTKGKYVLDINLPARVMFLRDKNMADSLSNRLFWRYGEYDSTYFSPIELQQPYYQIWKVKSDMYRIRD